MNGGPANETRFARPRYWDETIVAGLLEGVYVPDSAPKYWSRLMVKVTMYCPLSSGGNMHVRLPTG